MNLFDINSIVVVFFLGGCWAFHPLYHPPELKTPVIGFYSLSPDDDRMYFSLLTPGNSKICVYNFKSDSCDVLINRDSVWLLSPSCSSDGTKLIYIAANYYYKHQRAQGKACINYYDLHKKKSEVIYCSNTASLKLVVVSPDNKTVFFIASIPEYMRSPVDESIFSIELDGTGFKQIFTNHNSILHLSIDSNGENIYFNCYQDSILTNYIYHLNKNVVGGPYRLNLKTNKLISLTPTNLDKLDVKNSGFSGEYLHQWLMPLPSCMRDNIYLYDATEIFRYSETTGLADIFFPKSESERLEGNRIFNPVLFHHSNYLLMLKSDTTPGERKFVIVNDSGKIIKTFLPSIAKYSGIEK